MKLTTCDALQKGNSPIDFEEKLPHPANVHERLAVELRLSQGALLPNTLPLSCRKILEELEQDTFIHLSKTHASLTPKGRLFYDTVAERIIL